jgi:protein phosphatase
MISFSIQTDPGTQYEDNEDTVGCDEAMNVWVVADGMGGHAAGEVASRIAKDTFLAQLRGGEDYVASTLNAHAAIAASAEAQQAQQGMGSTLVGLQIEECHAHLVWVGDSRCYLWRGGELSVVTHDHSYVQMLIDQGHLTDETARDHPKRNMVTQVLGLGEPRPDTNSMPLQTGDWLVLCSDGLNDELTDAEISQTLIEANGDVEPVAGNLIQKALAHGGRDNVSVVAVAYDGPSAKVAGRHGSGSGGWQDTAIGQFIRSPVALGIVAAVAVFILFVYLTRGG